jgi:hypothetical protein
MTPITPPHRNTERPAWIGGLVFFTMLVLLVVICGAFPIVGYVLGIATIIALVAFPHRS